MLLPPTAMNAPDFPTTWQRKMIWTALTAMAVVAIGSIAVGFIWLISHVLGFLQPILVPFAVAAVMAYLLNPAVTKLVYWGTSRHRAVFTVFAVAIITLTGLGIWLLPALSTQSINLARKVPTYTRNAHARMIEFSTYMRQKYAITLLPALVPKPVDSAPEATPPATPSSPANPAAPTKSTDLDVDAEKTTPQDAATTGTHVPPPANGSPAAPDQTLDLQQWFSGDWLQATIQGAISNLVKLIRESLGGFMGVIGFLVSMVIVPIYLYYFLIEGPNIEKSWSDYLPLRASSFKDEVVSVLNEINGYLIAFFRGQLVVSLINGAITGIGLVAAGLEFGLLIGLALCVLGIIPYLGIAMCWLVSVIIASVQGGSWCVHHQPWWVFPLVISGVFVVVHNIDGLFVTPKIVGESVGLHPLTVIFSVFAWSLLMGGLLGAIVAVPMTATLKVLLRRYVWERQRKLWPSDSPINAPGGIVLAAPNPVPPPAVEASLDAGAPEPVSSAS